MKYPRTLVEAFPQHEAWRNVITHHRRPLGERLVRLACNVAVLATFAFCGVLLAWRG